MLLPSPALMATVSLRIGLACRGLEAGTRVGLSCFALMLFVFPGTRRLPDVPLEASRSRKSLGEVVPFGELSALGLMFTAVVVGRRLYPAVAATRTSRSCPVADFSHHSRALLGSAAGRGSRDGLVCWGRLRDFCVCARCTMGGMASAAPPVECVDERFKSRSSYDPRRRIVPSAPTRRRSTSGSHPPDPRRCRGGLARE
mmetsp:Transcript_43847/g.82004  ORF Transcript_43847/g.82004 Transcript_43847/m.82004 type:complete len:200 (+) Transcript_43847:150-749(+)